MADEATSTASPAGQTSTASPTQNTPPPEPAETQQESTFDDLYEDEVPVEEPKEEPKQEEKANALQEGKEAEGKEVAKDKGGKKDSPVSKKEEAPDPGEAPPQSKTEQQDEPLAPHDLVKVRIGDTDYDFPKDSYDQVLALVTKAQTIQENFKGFQTKFKENPTETLMDALLVDYQGDHDKAWDHLIRHYAQVVKQEIDFRSLPEAEQRATIAEQKLRRHEAELKSYREREQSERQRQAEAEEMNATVGEIARTLSELGYPRTKENQTEHMKYVRELYDEIQGLKAKGQKVAPAEVVKQRKAQRDREESEREKRAVQRLLQQKEKLLKDYPELISIAREGDIAALKNAGKPQAKTAKEPTSEAEPKAASRSKRTSMNSADWDKHFYGR